MNYQLDSAELASQVRNKRAGRPLRELVKEIGSISPATISRVEHEKTPDLTVFLLLCNWLQVPPAHLLRDLHHAAPAIEHEATADELTNLELFLGITPTLAFTTPEPADLVATYHGHLATAQAQIEALFAIGNIR